MQSEILNFDELNDFVTHSFEELCLCEQTFRNQICVELCSTSVGINAGNLEKIFHSLITLQCSQELLDNAINFFKTKLYELERATTNFENNFRGPDYLTPRDAIREDLYQFLLCINSKIQMVKEFVNDVNSSLEEMKKDLIAEPFEKLVQVMMKHLGLLEGIEIKVSFLNEYAQKILCSEMLIMKIFNLKQKCY